MALLKIEWLCKSFGGLQACLDVGFEVEEGEIIGLIGPNGSGKTTTLNLITGFLKPDSGMITVGGEDVTGLARCRTCRKGIARTFQLNKPFLEFTALQNVVIGARFADVLPGSEWKPRAQEMLERVGLGHRLNSKPSTLSVGERQRVAIARALVNRPKLLVADEPTGSLDPKSSEGVMDLLLELSEEEGVTLLLVTHEKVLADRLPDVFDCSDLVVEVDK